MNTYTTKLCLLGLTLLAVASNSYGNVDPYAGQFFKLPDASRATQSYIPYSRAPGTLKTQEVPGNRAEQISQDYSQSSTVS